MSLYEPRRTRRPSRGPSRRPVASAAVLLVALTTALSGCGESQQEKAQKTAMKAVCTAKADMKSRLAKLKTITPSAATLPLLKAEGAALLEDLKKIQTEQPSLAASRKQQVEHATQAFQGEVTAILSSFSSLTPSSLSSAAAQLQSALSRLEGSYVKEFTPIECS